MTKLTNENEDDHLKMAGFPTIKTCCFLTPTPPSRIPHLPGGVYRLGGLGRIFRARGPCVRVEIAGGKSPVTSCLNRRYMGVSKNRRYPKNGWVYNGKLENPIEMDDLRVALVSETSNITCSFMVFFFHCHASCVCGV